MKTPKRLYAQHRTIYHPELLDALPHTPPEELAQERQRFAEHRRRFAMQSRSRRRTQAQFAQLRRRWSALPAIGTG